MLNAAVRRSYALNQFGTMLHVYHSAEKCLLHIIQELCCTFVDGLCLYVTAVDHWADFLNFYVVLW